LDILINKIYLVYIPCPDKKDYEEYIFPNGLLYLYSSLVSNNYNTDAVMLSIDEMQEFAEELEDGDVVGISVNSSNKKVSFDFSRLIKKTSDKIKIIMGGPFISLIEDEKLKKINSVDCFFKFESEYSILEFLKGNITERVIYGERIRELDNLALPCENGVIYSNIMTSRGCPGKCIYCSSPELWKRKLFFRSPENILHELEILYKAGVDYFSFSDDTFTFDKKRIITLCHLIREKGLKIIFDVRSRIDAVDDKILEELALTGCVSISFGVESASSKIQSILSKKVDIKKAEHIIRKCRELFIKTNVFLIIGNPEENSEDIQQNIDFLRNSLPDWVTIYGLHYYPGTMLDKIYSKDIDWIDQKKTVFYEDENKIDNIKSEILKEHERYINDFKKNVSDIPESTPYRSVFWKYCDIAFLQKDKRQKIKWLKKALHIYESPEILFSLAIELEDNVVLEKAYKKFCFQIDNDIRKSPDFLKNAMIFFEYVGDEEYYYFVRSLFDKISKW
jgi:radical SAM superfamily enzyme YgiQ (UPF0313 family)